MSRPPERLLPEAVPDVASTAAALADRSRAAMCAALMDGRAWTANRRLLAARTCYRQ